MKYLKWLIPVTIISIALVMVMCEQPFPSHSGKAKTEEGCSECGRDKYGLRLEKSDSQDTVVLYHFYLWDYENQEWVELPEADSLKEDMLTWEEIDSLPDSERDYIKGLWPSWCLHIYDSWVHLLDDGTEKHNDGYYHKIVECGSKTRVLTVRKKYIYVSCYSSGNYDNACIRGKTVAVRFKYEYIKEEPFGPNDNTRWYEAIGNHYCCPCNANFGYTHAMAYY